MRRRIEPVYGWGWVAYHQSIMPPPPIVAEECYAKGPGIIAIQFENTREHVLSTLHALLLKRNSSIWTLIARQARFSDIDIYRSKTHMPVGIAVTGFCEFKLLWRRSRTAQT